MMSNKTIMVHQVAKYLDVEDNEVAVSRLFRYTIWQLEDIIQDEEKAKEAFKRITRKVGVHYDKL